MKKLITSISLTSLLLILPQIASADKPEWAGKEGGWKKEKAREHEKRKYEAKKEREKRKYEKKKYKRDRYAFKRGEVMERDIYEEGRVIRRSNNDGLVTISVGGKLVRVLQNTREIVDILSTKDQDFIKVTPRY